MLISMYAFNKTTRGNGNIVVIAVDSYHNSFMRCITEIHIYICLRHILHEFAKTKCFTLLPKMSQILYEMKSNVFGIRSSAFGKLIDSIVWPSAREIFSHQSIGS